MFGTSGQLPKIHAGRKPTAIRVVGGRDGLGPLSSPMQAGSFQHLKVSLLSTSIFVNSIPPSSK